MNLPGDAVVSVRLPHSQEADVAANREARMTGRQLLGLWYSGLWRLLIGLPIAAIAVALSWGPPMPSIPAASFILMAMGIGFLAYGTYLSWRGFSFIGDALTRKVTYVTGPLGREEKTYKSAKSYYMVVGPVKTLLYRRSTYEAVPAGVHCHAYYVPGSGHLLSLEPATAEEPHPSLRFGTDPTHAWDRLRWTWLLAAVAAYGFAAGVYATITAHPAQTVLVSGRLGEYHVVNSRKSTARYLHLQGSTTEYSLDGVESASPKVPDLYLFVNFKVDLYVNTDNGVDILAMRVNNECACPGIPNSRTLYAGDLYLHPEHQYWGMIWSGVPIAVLSGLTFVLFCWAIIHMRRHPVTEMTEVEKQAKEMSEVDKRAHEAMHM
jgi:hypothetical protein